MTTLPQSITRAFTILITLSVLCLLNGCASYHLGSSADLQFQSIYISPASNNSFAPQAQAIVSTQLRKTFIKDGRVKLVTKPEDADAVLLVDLVEYDRSSSARRSNDTAVASSFDISLSADISLYNQNKGSYFFEKRTKTATTNTYIGNPYRQNGNLNSQAFQQAEYQSMPELAREIARKIADEVLSPW